MKKAGQKTVEQSLKFMRVNYLLLSLSLLLPCISWGYPSPTAQPINRAGSGEDLTSVIKQMRLSISDLKNDVKNHETEIRMFEERLHNQENSNDHMQQQLSDEFQSQKDFSRATLVTLQAKYDNFLERITHIETQIEHLTISFSRLMEDVRQNASKTNESIAALSEHQQVIRELDSQVNAQNQTIANLENAIQLVVELIESNQQAENKNCSNEKIYKVQPGDTLEKIARSNKITIKQIKEMNQLNNDRINVGQVLRIP